ncbi:Sugar phosphate isomerase/epimerase [Caldanaerobius fijiensis DSM 17918]|uniref:Sugar phosphate isomerase/epimerase n=1 Tax=Caldanaerobius fijiensis DSM 17918 TaxID=1121256 RepID=A0A1M5BQM6_9THEO|nr:sugar phosphate isomerase/epimerase [Caldanaerobius fijiensis]SHF44809.1 Sugar phosphate isomerase/epimerase [Caldanaerobius fijiensis DSM 17918]
MRLGGPLFYTYSDPEQWIQALKKHGYGAAYCPVTVDDEDAVVEAYVKVANKADIIISEVGAWSNPLSADEVERRAAIKKCKEQLALADRIGARCCVNISGSRGEQWDGPHPDNFTSETFDMIVATVREIIDDVKPIRTFYTLEPMPWMYPDSADSYLELIKAIDRKSFAVHFDPVNLICSPQRYYNNGALIRDFINKLGPYIKSCHAKDITLSGKLTTHLSEVRPGCGSLDYITLLRNLEALDADMPLMIEHLSSEEECNAAADYIRSKAREAGVKLKFTITEE